MTGLAPGTLFVDILAALAGVDAVYRTWRGVTSEEPRLATRWTLTLIVLQAMHFVEEFFYRLPYPDSRPYLAPFPAIVAIISFRRLLNVTEPA